MSFHNKGLLGEGSSPGTPLTLDEEEGTRKKLRTLTSDPLSRDLGDPEFMAFKTKQFERAYPGKQKLDASGRAIDSPPVVKDVESFKPRVKRADLDFGAAVGEGETARNDLSDLIGAKRGLSNTKLFSFDVTREPSNVAGKRFTDAVKRFQTNRGLKIDGLMNPEGPTIKALRSLLFPPGTASNVGQPVDLSRAAARPLATPVAAPLAGGQPKADAPPALGDAPPEKKPAGSRAGGDGRGFRQAAETETAEMRVERPIPPDKRGEFNARLNRANALQLDIFNELSTMETSKKELERMLAPPALLARYEDLTKDLESLAGIFKDRDVAQAVKQVREQVDKVMSAFGRNEAFDFIELQRRVNRAMELLDPKPKPPRA
jgi:peptidoglycan hydrolase-like protein with peptidoglycan-binding domain